MCLPPAIPVLCPPSGVMFLRRDIVAVEPGDAMRRSVRIPYPPGQIFDVALQAGPTRGQVVELGALARTQDGTPGARHPQALITAQGPVEIIRLARDQFSEGATVLDTHRRTLRQKGQHRVRRIAEQRNPSFGPLRQGLAVEQPPFEIAVAALEK